MIVSKAMMLLFCSLKPDSQEDGPHQAVVGRTSIYGDTSTASFLNYAISYNNVTQARKAGPTRASVPLPDALLSPYIKPT